MNILYISSYPLSRFNKIIKETKSGSSICAQKFNSLIIKGLKENGHKVTVLVTYDPIMDENPKIYQKEFEIEEDGIVYHFSPMLHIKYIGTKYVSLYLKKYTNKFLRENGGDCCLMFDLLKSYLLPIVKVFKKNKAKICGIVTDLPIFFSKSSNNIIEILRNKKVNNMYNNIENAITHYVFLTEAMNYEMNRNNVPYIIVEGIADFEINTKTKIEKDSKKIVLYTGDLSKMYGLMNLINGFILADIKNSELHLYGRCDYQDEMKKICEEHANIKFFGIVNNQEIVEKQKKATLLINPRPLNLDFNKFSFPSKVMEYMASGTATSTTRLSGIPNEYEEYVYFIDDDSVDGIKEKLLALLEKDNEELDQKGKLAQQYVLNKKNNVIQAKRIIELIEKSREEKI